MRRQSTQKEHICVWFNGSVQKVFSNYLLNIYRQQKFTFKLTIEFSFLRIKVDDDDFNAGSKEKEDKPNYIQVNFDLRLASTNTRPEGFKNPVVVDNKADIGNIV